MTDKIYGRSPGMIALSDKPMTATELEFRMEEALLRFPVPDFSHALQDIARRVKRAALLSALRGSSKDRLEYCLSRAAAKPMIDLACFGISVCNLDKTSELASRWFLRLERIARG